MNLKIKKDDIVNHKLFGKGKVLEIEHGISIVLFFNSKYGTRKIKTERLFLYKNLE